MLSRRIFPESIIGLLTGMLVAASFFFTVYAVDDSTLKTCQRQQQSAQAVPYLIDSMDGIYQLLTLPQDKSVKQRQEQLPPKARAREVKIVTDLDKNLVAFVRIERALPKRTC